MKIFALSLMLLLAACAASDSKDAGDNPARKAAETNTTLGQAYMDRGQYEIALDKLKRAIAHDRTYAPAHTVLGLLYERLGEPDMAGQQYKEAVRLDPKDGDVNNNYGAYLCRYGQGRQAEPYFLAAVKDPFYQTPWLAYSNAGSCSLELGDLDKAESYLRQSLEFNNEFAPALFSMADVSYQKGAYLRARGFLQRFEAVSAMNEESLLLGFRIESALDDSVSANRYRLELIERFPNSPEASHLAGQERE
jgi:type IV pilus assembly protein PilF